MCLVNLQSIAKGNPLPLGKEHLAHYPNKTGVYLVYIIQPQGLPFQLPRWNGQVDDSGLIYIGRSERQTLQKRIQQFCLSYNEGGGTTNHTAGLKLRDRCNWQHELTVRFHICNNAAVMERSLLDEYVRRYWEYPPLNK
jgi:hypothetical protein